MFFQIHKNDKAVDSGIPQFEKASAASTRGGENVDASDRITRRYTLREYRVAARRFRQDYNKSPQAI